MIKSLNDEFMQHIATEQMWKELSENFQWTEALLEKYADKVDWKEISCNHRIQWTIPMLQKFAKKLDWSSLSASADEDWFTEVHLETFKDKWDWEKISRYVKFTTELIDKYIDYIKWSDLIGCSGYPETFHNSDIDCIAFFEKYKQYIPMTQLQDSSLWKGIIEQMSKQMETELLS
jgi:hypothetical protein